MPPLANAPHPSPGHRAHSRWPIRHRFSSRSFRQPRGPSPARARSTWARCHHVRRADGAPLRPSRSADAEHLSGGV